ncbi:hypothetical protein BKA70DRAFT_1274693 [Coprinopsis sp. MPI-PUGE-AT-0042]|nr:hypothetical protein BKA70DRAFT_1274693 [Coprinopsis sp. MPI-PUGE-AT-0042]
MSGLVGEIITTVEIGKVVLERYRLYRNASADLKRLEGLLSGTLFTLEVFEKAIRVKLKALVEYEERIMPLVEALQGVFERLNKQTSRYPSGATLDFIKKMCWTFGGKSGVEAILKEMQEYQNALHGVIVGIKLIFDDRIINDSERTLMKELYQGGGVGVRHADVMDDVLHGLSPESKRSPRADLEIFSLPSIVQEGDRSIIRFEDHIVLVEYRYLEARSSQETAEAIADVHKLASVLANVDEEAMHILRCLGTADQLNADRIALLYRIPQPPMAGAKWTLHDALRTSEKPPLDVRIRYALEICEAVMYTHAAGLVHKLIYPGNILLFPSQESSHRKSIFLAGFDASRLQDLAAYSQQAAETDPVKRLYQHPERHSPNVEGKVARFGLRHDMYSVGVVLLEVGMWRPLGKINDKLDQLARNFDARKLHNRLLEAARRLSFQGGSKYANAVLCCLQDTVSQNDTQEEIKRTFLEKVVQSMKEIVV